MNPFQNTSASLTRFTVNATKQFEQMSGLQKRYLNYSFEITHKWIRKGRRDAHNFLAKIQKLCFSALRRASTTNQRTAPVRFGGLQIAQPVGLEAADIQI